MIGDAEPEDLIRKWAHDTLGYRTWSDPDLPSTHDWNAPIGHFQRGQDAVGSQLSLDSVLMDVEWYGQIVDKVKNAARECHMAMLTQLPRTTFANGLFVMSVATVMAPAWLPDLSHRRRGASYRVFLHGWVPPT